MIENDPSNVSSAFGMLLREGEAILAESAR